MKPADRKAFAEQIITNPLFAVLMTEQEQAAFDQAVYAGPTDHETRAMATMKVQAIRAFRADCEAAARSTPTRKGAPA